MKTVRLDDGFVEKIKVSAAASLRSVPKQIEYLARIGQQAEDFTGISATLECKPRI